METLGIDIGGTSLKAVYFDGKHLKSFFLPTPKNKIAFVAALSDLVLACDKQIDHVGFGIPGQVNQKTVRARRVKKLPYLVDVNFKKLVRDLLPGRKAVVHIDNDVNCHLNAELKLGDASKYKTVAMIAIGTGIGGAIAFGGQLYRGYKGSAGEIGHIILERGKTFEQLASAAAIKKYNSKEIKRAAYYTGLACATVANILNPEAIILSGGVVHFNAVHSEAAKIMRQHTVSGAWKTKLVVSKMGEYGGAIGAAWL